MVPLWQRHGNHSEFGCWNILHRTWLHELFCQVSIGPQRYFFQPIDSARSRKDWRSMLMPYLRMIPFWFAVTRHCRQPGPYFLGCVFVRLGMALSYQSIVLKQMVEQRGLTNKL